VGPLIPPRPLGTPSAGQPRGNRRVVLLVLGTVAVAGLVGITLKMRGSPPIVPREAVDHPVPVSKMQEGPAEPAPDLRMSTTYAGRPVPRLDAPAAPAPPLAQSGTTPVPAPPTRTVVVKEPRPPAPPPQLPSPQRPAGPPASTPPAGTPAVVPGTPGPPRLVPEKPRRWYTPEPAQGTTNVLTSPFGEEKDDAAKTQSKLFPPVIWEKPVRPERVIYSSQLIHGMLEQVIVTGETATVRVRTSETLYDRWGLQEVLVPMDSYVMATMEGTPRRGQNRVGLGVEKIQLPDGSDIGIAGKVGDATGAVGVPGKVNNHYPELLVGAILTTALSVGARTFAGNTQGFNPTLEQEFARDMGQSVNQTGNQIIRDLFNIPPTIEVPAQLPVTIQLRQNVSLQGTPVLITK
jgi:type IV secretory pathway VirB10-like protein